VGLWNGRRRRSILMSGVESVGGRKMEMGREKVKVKVRRGMVVEVEAGVPSLGVDITSG
jgi:hypothetical protein